MQKEGNCLLGDYLASTIGLAFRKTSSDGDLLKGLPQYLKGAFSTSLVEIEGQAFLLLKPSAEVDTSTSRIVKFARQIGKQTDRPTLIQFQSMDSIRRRTLIHHRENFVVVGKQIYIPSLRIYLNEAGSIRQLSGKDHLSPSAQFLLLYHLQKNSLEKIPLKEIAEALNYSRKTVSVVAAELQKLSVGEVEQLL